MDVLTSRPEPPPLYFTNPDFLFSGRFSSPRLAQGAWRTALESIYQQYTGRSLPYQLMGKPELVTFRWAERMQQQRADEMGAGEVVRRYMIGDNTAADIRGGNRAGWTSVFVRTGTIRRERGRTSSRLWCVSMWGRRWSGLWRTRGRRRVSSECRAVVVVVVVAAYGYFHSCRYVTRAVQYIGCICFIRMALNGQWLTDLELLISSVAHRRAVGELAY